MKICIAQVGGMKEIGNQIEKGIMIAHDPLVGLLETDQDHAHQFLDLIGINPGLLVEILDLIEIIIDMLQDRHLQ